MRREKGNRGTVKLAGCLAAAGICLLLGGAGSAEAGIQFERREPEGRTEEGIDLYQGSAGVTVMLSAPGSGIAKVTWRVEAEGSRILESGRADFADAGRAGAAGFTVLEQQAGAVIKAEKQLQILEESQEIMLRVGMEEQNGKESWRSIYLAVDGSAPELLLETEGQGKYRREPQKYLLQVRDRNLTPEKITVQGLPLPPAWQRTEAGMQAEFFLEEEGDYSFSVSAEDRAGNKTRYTVGDSFTLDRTAPSIAVTETDGRALDPHSRNPLITVEDRAIDSGAVTMALEGRKSGEVHIQYRQTAAEEGKLCFQLENLPGQDDFYTLRVQGRDLAGNISAAEASFTVNRSGSRYAVSGELERVLGAYTAEPPEILLTEENIDRLREETIEVWMVRNGVSRQLERGGGYTVVEEETAEGSRYQYAVSPGVFEADGVYAFLFRSEDEAGNSNESELFFREKPLSFWLDRVKPLIQRLVPEEKNSEHFRIQDNFLLKQVEFCCGGEQLSFRQEGDSYYVSLPPDPGGTLEVRAVDAAGNGRLFLLRGMAGKREDAWLSPGVFGALAGAGLGLIPIFMKIKKGRKSVYIEP